MLRADLGKNMNSSHIGYTCDIKVVFLVAKNISIYYLLAAITINYSLFHLRVKKFNRMTSIVKEAMTLWTSQNRKPGLSL